MARFTIYSPDGDVALYTGTPTFNGSYMNPGSLTFRQIASPTPIDFEMGCYVDYSVLSENDVELRTGFRYYLYSLPQMSKTATQGRVGDSFVYDSVTFYDSSKLLDHIPFRDIVFDDNSEHYSTQESFSTYEAVDGIALRLQSCVEDLYPNDVWLFRLATTDMGAPPSIVELMTETREFSASSLTVLGALNHIYEVWPEVGWVYTYEQINGDWTNVITIGGVGTVGSTDNYLYGKGNGLLSIKRNIANENAIINRLYPFGNTTNLPPRWYNKQNIHLAESADIRHLMLPISSWGTDSSDSLPSPFLAYIEDAESIAENGLRPGYVYFDGNNNLDDIYPTIKGLTTTNLRSYYAAGGAVDYPPTSDADGLPLDELIAVIPDSSGEESTFDTGLTNDDEYISLATGQSNISYSATGTIPSAQTYSVTVSLGNATISVTPSSALTKVNLITALTSVTASVVGTTNPSRLGLTDAHIQISLVYSVGGVSCTKLFTVPFEISSNAYGPIARLANDATKTLYAENVDASVVKAYFSIIIGGTSMGACAFSVSVTALANLFIKKQVLSDFQVYINPFGYDLANLVATDGNVRIAMTSGACAGREFTLKACYVDENYSPVYSLRLTLERQYDESLSQYFPNYDYPVAIGDTFVILGIAMPDFYITSAATKLATKAAEYLATYQDELWQYTPEVDAKFMVENERVIIPGQKIVLVDGQIVDPDDGRYQGYEYLKENGGEYYLTNYYQKILLAGGGYAYTSIVDSVTISEDESEIPTYKVTLRDRKKQKSGGTSSSSRTSSGVVVVSAGTGGTEWFNIKPAKDSNGYLTTIIENYSSSLANSSKYKMVLLRWRKSSSSPRYNSWHAPLFSNSSENAIASADRSWAISSNEQRMFATSGNQYTDVIPLATKLQATGNRYIFKNSSNAKMRFGCAIYKYTGVGTWGWQRVSNIAEYELYVQRAGVVRLNIRT